MKVILAVIGSLLLTFLVFSSSKNRLLDLSVILHREQKARTHDSLVMDDTDRNLWRFIQVWNVISLFMVSGVDCVAAGV